jgi:hypothetical protein
MKTPIKFIAFGVIAAGSLLAVGAVRLATPDAPEETTTPVDALPQIEQAVNESRELGRQQGIREAVAPETLPASLAARSAVLETATDFAYLDLENLVCARSAQYLKAASERQHQQSVDVERWLLDQLTNENTAIKELMAANGSMDGSAQSAESLDSPLLNRAAILDALDQLYTGESRSCRVAAFDSATRIEAFNFEARRIKDNQHNAVTSPAPVEVANDG